MSIPTTLHKLGNKVSSWMKWDLTKWKEELQHRTENLPLFRSTPDAIKNATTINSLFSDADSTITTPTNYFKGSELPSWEYAHATNCDYFNYGNTSTIKATFNAPNCTSAQYAFYGNTNLTSIDKIEVNERANFYNFARGCKSLASVPSSITGYKFKEAFMGTALVGDLTINYYGGVSECIWTTFLNGAPRTGDLNLTINRIGKLGTSTFRCVSGFTNYPNLKSLVVNGMIGGTSSDGFCSRCNNLTKLEVNIDPTETWGTVMQSFAAGCTSLTKLKITGMDKQPSSGVNTSSFIEGSTNMQFIDTSHRIISTRIFRFAHNCPKITQVALNCKNVKASGYATSAFNACKLDLETVKNLADDNIGLPQITISNPIIIGISLYKLAKDTSPETLAEYPLFTTGKTKFNVSNNLLYLDSSGNETSSRTQAVVNDYITADLTDKIDITTVTDVSSFTDTDWNNHYGYPFQPTGSTITYYAIGELLKALRTITDRGWTITVQYN